MHTPSEDDSVDPVTVGDALSAAEAEAKAEADFGERVREARQILGMTQRQLGKAVGVDASAVSRLEQGARAIRLGEAALIAKAVRTDIRQLLYGKLSDDPRLELYGALDELETAATQMRDADNAAAVSVDHLKTALERPEVREYLSSSPVDADSVIRLCRGVLESLYEHDHPRLLRLISAKLVDMDQPDLKFGPRDVPET